MFNARLFLILTVIRKPADLPGREPRRLRSWQEYWDVSY